MLGVLLFIVSEIFAFLSVFWAFFHSSLSPSIEIGGIWPPLGITPLDPFAIPLVNTFLLLSSGVSHKCEIFDLFVLFHCSSLPFSSPRVNPTKRIGPHNSDILSIFIGSLLGDGSMEKSLNGSRFVYTHAKLNGEYLLWLHQVISKLGYADQIIPKLYIRKDSELVKELNEIRSYDNYFCICNWNEINFSLLPYNVKAQLQGAKLKTEESNCSYSYSYSYRLRSFTFYSLNWLYEAFYPNKTRKVIPEFINIYLTPLALAVWMMDDGKALKKKGFKFSTNSFTLKEVQNLASTLKTKYNLETTIHKSGLNNQYNIYVPKTSFIILREIVKPYFHPTMLYKLN
jgi:hypothetical protein